MSKKKAGFFIILLLIFSIAAAPAFGWQNNKKGNQAKGKLEAKFFGQVRSLLSHKGIIDLKDEQVDQIKKLHLDTKKALIRSNAEIEIVALDIKSSLFYAEKIDLKTVEKLIDQKYKLKKDKAKVLVRAFVQVNDLLTEEQKNMAKDLRVEAKQKFSKGAQSCQYKAKGMCPKMKALEKMSK